ncbi:site-specific DNA-methyltransferase [uncultured Prevotella sp.]|mgnify:FL=1|jgi:putative modification enzyme of type III restriction-modification system|uniref:site-specific DNA-methyltransferase n=1 Tax=uncultured Prevotella sp. TaxID=159272 RepID=UPI00259B399F|nr:site-specific DNA-methyltransferase [uncultured Prevotella sp.]
MEFKKQPLTSATHSEFTLEALRQIAPSAFTEVRGADGELTQKVDFKVLRELLGDAIADADEESFGFQWVGKQEAKRAAAEPTRQTLRPVVDDSVDWDTTENLYIEGDNLEVLKLLQRAYLGKVKMIYIDPPYNTGNDFVYEDDFAMSGEEMDEAMGNVDEEGNRLRRNLDSNPRYHSDWCSMIYSRLLVARTLLANDGVIFISIDDNEVHHLRKICDEVFGAGNFLAQVVWERAYAPINLMKHFSPSHDYIVCYAKDVDLAICNGIPRSSEADARYSNPDNDPRGVWQSDNLSVGPAIEANIYPITTPSGRVVEPPAGRSWSLSANAFAERLRQNRIWFGSDGNGVPRMKRFLSELRKTGVTPMTIWKYEEVGHSQDATKALAGIFDGKKYFDYPKPVDLIKRCISLYSSPDSLILDFFSGSATTAHAVMQLNAEDGGKRKYICVQLPEETPEGSEARKAGYETICEIGKERIRRAGKKIKEEAGLMGQDLDTGFRVLRTDSSNMEDVYFEPAGLEQQNLFTQVDSVKTDRSELDLLFGCMVDWGVELSYPLRTEEVDGKHLHIVNEGALVACFDKEISVEAVSRIAELKPLRVIFREECFATDADKLNIYEKFKQFCGWNDEEVYKRIHVL